jgi:hypothetical protein
MASSVNQTRTSALAATMGPTVIPCPMQELTVVNHMQRGMKHDHLKQDQSLCRLCGCHPEPHSVRVSLHWDPSRQRLVPEQNSDHSGHLVEHEVRQQNSAPIRGQSGPRAQGLGHVSDPDQRCLPGLPQDPSKCFLLRIKPEESVGSCSA